MDDLTVIVRHFISSRWLRKFSSRQQLLAWQQKRLDRFLERVVRDVPFYLGRKPVLSELPMIEKAMMREHFSTLNPFEIRLEEAEKVAMAAEVDRDFSSQLPGGLTVGLSSGTSGRRGVFLVSAEDRLQWAGTVLGKMLSTRSLWQILLPWRAPLRIAFFLRADSNLYRTVASRRVDFRFFDLLRPLDHLVHELNACSPHLLIAPASVLVELAKRDDVEIHPQQIISVAEVLDEYDEAQISKRFQVRPAQIYQATEGFIACSCREGSLHLNEEILHVEPSWVGDSTTHFQPVITDFSRTAQAFVRYRLDDVLVKDEQPCRCGNPTLRLARIEGRADEVLRFPEPIFPDVIRQALYSMPVTLDLYRIEQYGEELRISLKNSCEEWEGAVTETLESLFTRLGIRVPRLVFLPWVDQAAGEKQRRIRCIYPISIAS